MKTVIEGVGRWAVKAAAALLCACSWALGATASAQVEALASVRSEAPDTGGAWPLRFVAGVGGPAGALSVVTSDGQPLPTQLEVHLRNPDGTPRSVWVSALVPGDLELPDGPQFALASGATPPAGPGITPATRWALTRAGRWQVEVEGIDGGTYVAEFAPARSETLRSGPVEYAWRVTALVKAAEPEGDPVLQLPHVGLMTLDLRCWAGIDAIDVRLLWEGGVMDDPNPWALFSGVRLIGPRGAELRTLETTLGVGELEQTDRGAELVLVEPGEHVALAHHAKLWSLAATVPGQFEAVAPVLRGGGWGLAEDGPWSVHETPVTTMGLQLPRVTEAMTAYAESELEGELGLWLRERDEGLPHEDAPAVTAWRQPSGIAYGGGTGGSGIDPWPFVDLVAANPAQAYRWLGMRVEARLDRTRLSLVTSDGSAWDPSTASAPFNLRITPSPIYAGSWQTLWPTPGQDLGMLGIRPEYREATDGRAAAAMEAERGYGNDDLQHWVRGRRGLWPLVELYAEPMAELVLERQTAALRADVFEGSPDQPGHRYQSTLRWLAERKGQGHQWGRDFAWAGWHVGLDYACQDDAGRAALEPWLDLWVETLQDAPLDSGAFQVITGGKEFKAGADARAAEGLTGAPVAVGQAFQQSLVAAAGLQVRGAYEPEGLDDPIRALVAHVCRDAWAQDSGRPDYRYATGTVVDGSVGPAQGREAVEALYASTVHKASNGGASGFQSRHVPLALAAHALLDAGAFPDRALGRYLGAAPGAALRELALEQSAESPPNWWPLLAALEVSD